MEDATDWDGMPENPTKSGYHWLLPAFAMTEPHAVFWKWDRQQWKGEHDGKIAWVSPEQWAGNTMYLGPAYAPGWDPETTKKIRDGAMGAVDEILRDHAHRSGGHCDE